MVICVGAMMVGSTVITRSAGEKVRRAEELGYFKFGGSTILLLFEPGAMQFDEDLVANSKEALETLVRFFFFRGFSLVFFPSSLFFFSSLFIFIPPFPLVLLHWTKFSPR
jgi:hypothetical protein